jgi:hypothetical protein
MNLKNDKRKLIVVDLEALTGRVFVGRSNGKLARKHFKLEAYNEEKNSIQFVIPQGTISVNSSFFLGLFGPDVQRIEDYNKFFEYVDISKVDVRYQQQLQLAVQRTLSSSGYGL